MNRRDWFTAAPVAAVVIGGRDAMGATDMSATSGVHFEHVKSLIMGWRRKDLAAVLELCADDIVWYSHVGSPPIVGKTAMRGFMEKLSDQMPVVRWRIFHYAESGDVVFTEGVDDFTAPDGKTVTFPSAGVLRFRGGQIVGGRDYFDRASFDRFKAGEPPAEHMSALMNRPALF